MVSTSMSPKSPTSLEKVWTIIVKLTISSKDRRDQTDFQSYTTQYVDVRNVLRRTDLRLDWVSTSPKERTFVTLRDLRDVLNSKGTWCSLVETERDR